VKPKIEKRRDLTKSLLPFNGAWRFGGYITDNTVHSLDAVDDPVGNPS
jgi:hypothetical protein